MQPDPVNFHEPAGWRIFTLRLAPPRLNIERQAGKRGRACPGAGQDTVVAGSRPPAWGVASRLGAGGFVSRTV
jgi:hypothetical protein